MATTDRRGLEALERQLLGTVIEPARSVWTPQLAAAAKWVADVAPDRLAARSTALLQALAAYDPSGADQAARAQAIDQAARALANELGTSVEGLVGAKSYKKDSEKQTIDGARTLLDAAAIALTSWSGAFARFEAADEGQGSGTEVGPLYLRNATTRDPVGDPYVLDVALTARAETGYFVLQYSLDALTAEERLQLETDHILAGSDATELGEREESALMARLDSSLEALVSELTQGDPDCAMLAPIPTHGWLIRSNKSLAQLAKLRHVRFVDIFQPAFKLTDTLRERVVSPSSGRIGLRLVPFPGESVDAVVTAIKALGGTARIVDHLDYDQGSKATQRVVGAVVPERALAAVAQLRELYLIDEDALPGALLDVAHGHTGVTAARVALGLIIPPPPNLNGAGQIIGIYDSGVDNGTDLGAPIVADFTARVFGDVANWVGPVPASWADRMYDGVGIAGHGTQVAGIAIGDGNLSANALVGVAPGATARIRPWSADFQAGWPVVPMVFDINRALTNALANGALIHNDSWGESSGVDFNHLNFFTNQYRHSDRQIDAFTRANPQMLVVTSAGNNGAGASTITSPGTGKNVLTVGASGNGNPAVGNGAVVGAAPNAMAGFSSRGPAPAHRLKPDVVAPGNKIASIRAQGIAPNVATNYLAHPDYKYGGGTSFAAPYVSGTAALIRQFLANGAFHAGNAAIGLRAAPSGMLIKAMIVNGAAPLAAANVPNDDEGWGRINLDRSINPAHLLLVYDSLDPNDPQNAAHAVMLQRNGVTRRDFAIQVAAGQPLSITMAYYDRTDGGALGALVYDLDLVVREPGTLDLFRGGVPGSAAGESRRLHTAPQKRNVAYRDRFNTVEKVYIANPIAGQYSVRVKRRTIPWTWPNQPPEKVPFALVVRQD